MALVFKFSSIWIWKHTSYRALYSRISVAMWTFADWNERNSARFLPVTTPFEQLWEKLRVISHVKHDIYITPRVRATQSWQLKLKRWIEPFPFSFNTLVSWWTKTKRGIPYFSIDLTFRSLRIRIFLYVHLLFQMCV